MLLLLAALLQAGAPQAPAERAAALWKQLSPAEKREAVDWLSAEVDLLRGLRTELRSALLVGSQAIVAEAPRAEPPPWFDPQLHAPAQPIPRRRLEPGNPELERVRARLLRKHPERALRPAFEYDAGLGRVVRVGEPLDPERVLACALAGYGPRDDLVEALVLSALDDGAERKALAAFGHVYTDRAGNAYGELTLYDAWASGAEIEMPDVDCLGILHEVLGDWKSFKAPVPASRQKKLYDTIGKLFTAAHRHLGLRRALAATYLAGSPPLRDGYALRVELLHSLWAEAESDPARLAERLPAAKGWELFLEREGRAFDRDPERVARARARRERLDAEAQAVREAVLRVLEGLLEQRDAAPALGGPPR